jgi:deferrochelatase/peroxidase EfeB
MRRLDLNISGAGVAVRAARGSGDSGMITAVANAGDQDHATDRPARQGLTRRRALSATAMLGIGAGLDHVIAKAPQKATVEPSLGSGPYEGAIPFYGAHQAGIATPAQDYLSFAAFDLSSEAIEDLSSLLQEWTAAAASLTAGRSYQPVPQESSQPPEDTGEAIGLAPAQLTITIGFGPSLFATPSGQDRLGLRHLKPPMLQPLPPFQGENLDPNSSGGDLCVQACANDPQVAFHATHLFSRVASSVASLRWAQLGFGRTSSTSHTQVTPRNLMGFKDGTDNIRAEDTTQMNDYVWVAPHDNGPAWMTGGTYLIARRIKILFDVWDTTSLEGQQRTIGRDKLTGAPLGSNNEYDPVKLTATAPNGEPLIPANAHIRLANPQNNDEQRILRRGYSYSEPIEPGSGQIDAGLFFIAYQRNPDQQFIPLQRRLAANDALNHHTLHTSSAIFACPPGTTTPDGFIGDTLFS